MRLILPALALLALTACGSKDGDGKAKAPAGPKVSAADKGAARVLFAERCVSCHGENGKGDGPAGKMLNPKPRSFADAAWQKKTTDEHLRKIIVGGGTAVGMSQLMPPNPDLENKPGVVNGLIAIIRKQGG
jgi:mono/diheme cytochrome c family protein